MIIEYVSGTYYQHKRYYGDAGLFLNWSVITGAVAAAVITKTFTVSGRQTVFTVSGRQTMFEISER